MADREIKVRINGDTSGLDRGLSRSKANLLAFAKVGAVAVAAVGAALVAMTGRSMQNIDALAKQARSLGLTTRALQNMSMVAGEAGVSTEQLSGMLGLMQRNIVELTNGTARQTDSFNKLGLSIRDLQGLSPDEQFRRIAESLNRIEDPAERTALAMDVFGRSGRAAINMLEDYSAKVEEAAEFNRRFNIEVSDIDAAKIEQANDAWARVRTALGGVGNTIATAVSPAIVKMSELMLNGIEHVMNFARSFRLIAAQARLGALAMKSVFLESIVAISSAFIGLTQDIARGMNELFNTNLQGLDYAMLGTANMSGELTGLAGAAVRAYDAMKLAESGVNDLANSINSDGAGDGVAGVADLPEMEGDVAPSVGGAGSVTNAMAERLAALQQGLMTEQETIAAWYAESRMTLDDALAQELLTREQYAEAVERLEDEHQRRLQAIREMGNKWGVQAALSGGAEILGAMGQMNEKALKASKVFAAAEALVSTYQGAAAELRKGTFGFASAAAVIARGIGFVAAIKGVNASGGGSSGGGGGSAAAPATPAQQQQPATTFAFNIQNDGMGIGENVIRQIIEQLNSTSRDGGRIQAVLA